jgi:hypothetical protein
VVDLSISTIEKASRLQVIVPFDSAGPFSECAREDAWLELAEIDDFEGVILEGEKRLWLKFEEPLWRLKSMFVDP